MTYEITLAEAPYYAIAFTIVVSALIILCKIIEWFRERRKQDAVPSVP